MKKFNFSLQKVLEIKEQILENLKIEFGNLNNELSNIDAAMIKLKKQFSDIDKEYFNKLSVSISVGEITYYKMLMSSILKQIDNKEDEKLIILSKMESKRQEIVNMNMEISSIGKLKEREIEKYNKLFTKSEEIFIEEFVSNKSMTKEFAI